MTEQELDTLLERINTSTDDAEALALWFEVVEVRAAEKIERDLWSTVSKRVQKAFLSDDGIALVRKMAHSTDETASKTTGV